MEFVDYIVKVLVSDVDEVLVVGYSFGVYLVVLVILDLLWVGYVKLDGFVLFFLFLG